VYELVSLISHIKEGQLEAEQEAGMNPTELQKKRKERDEGHLVSHVRVRGSHTLDGNRTNTDGFIRVGDELTPPFRHARTSPLTRLQPVPRVTHIRWESVGVVHRSRPILRRPVPNPTRPTRKVITVCGWRVRSRTVCTTTSRTW
jgi:hypothetical protein